MSRDIHIERKDWSVARSAATLLDQLRRSDRVGRGVTSADAVALTGLPESDAAAALLFLAAQCGARTHATDRGIEFVFDDLTVTPRMLRLPAWLRPIYRAVQPALGRLGELIGLVLFGGSVGATAFVYASIVGAALTATGAAAGTGVAVLLAALVLLAFMCAIPLVMLVASLLPLGSVLAAFAGGQWLTGLGLLLPALLLAPLGLALTYVVATPHRWLLRAVRARFAGTFLNFGRVRADALADERAFVQLLLARGPILRIRDLIELYGWTHDRAFHELTQLMLDYGGDVEVDEHGTLSFDFSALISRVGEGGRREADVAPIWEVERPPAQVFDARARRTDLYLMGGWVAAVAPALVLFAQRASIILGNLAAAGAAAQAATVGAVALTAFVPLFVLTRRFVVARRQRAYERGRRAEYLEWIRRAAESPDGFYLEPEAVDEQFVLDLGGDLDVERVDEQGRVYVQL